MLQDRDGQLREKREQLQHEATEERTMDASMEHARMTAVAIAAVIRLNDYSAYMITMNCHHTTEPFQSQVAKAINAAKNLSVSPSNLSGCKVHYHRPSLVKLTDCHQRSK